MMTAKAGDAVKIGGRTYEIKKVYYSAYFSPEGWMIEFVDTNGQYHYWKQYLDGGELLQKGV